MRTQLSVNHDPYPGIRGEEPRTRQKHEARTRRLSFFVWTLSTIAVLLLAPLPAASQVHTLSGKFAQNKGMALFPRKVGGQYMMSGRIDNENLYIMKSDHVLVWNHAEVVQTPKFPWELVQLGNCGSPLETEEGWLLLTHGVGPLRQYCIGAVLLDLEVYLLYTHL